MKLRKAIIVFFLILSFEGTGFAQLAQVGPTGPASGGTAPAQSATASRGCRAVSAHLHNKYNCRAPRLQLSLRYLHPHQGNSQGWNSLANQNQDQPQRLLLSFPQVEAFQSLSSLLPVEPAA